MSIWLAHPVLKNYQTGAIETSGLGVPETVSVAFDEMFTNEYAEMFHQRAE